MRADQREERARFTAEIRAPIDEKAQPAAAGGGCAVRPLYEHAKQMTHPALSTSMPHVPIQTFNPPRSPGRFFCAGWRHIVVD